MNLPIKISIKSFFGLYVLTPFEKDLLNHLRNALKEKDKRILDFQLENFTTIRRLLKYKDVPNAHGYTNFYTTRFGKNLKNKYQTMRFDTNKAEELFASTHVSFEEGDIDVQFWLVQGVLVPTRSDTSG